MFVKSYCFNELLNPATSSDVHETVLLSGKIIKLEVLLPFNVFIQ